MKKLIFNENSVTLLNGNNIIIASTNCFDTKEGYEDFYQNKKDYGNENRDFLDIFDFIGFELHSIQQMCSNFLFVNGYEIIGAASIEDTHGFIISESTLVQISGGNIIRLNTLLR